MTPACLRRRRFLAPCGCVRCRRLRMGVQAADSALARALVALVIAVAMLSPATAHADRLATIERVRNSVVAIGTFERTRSPQFQFLGTGFAVGDGTIIVTNAHVVPPLLDAARSETIAILLPGRTKDAKDEIQVRDAKQIAIDIGV